MGMTPKQFFEGFVDLNRWDCHGERAGDIRKAFNAAVSASHLADHYFKFNKKYHPEKVNEFWRVGDFVDFLNKETNGAFQDIRSMSNAYKHLYNSDGPSAQYETIDSCGAIEGLEISGDPEISEVIDGHLAEVGAEEPDKEHNYSVVMKKNDGTQSKFLPALDTVVDYFERLLQDETP